MGELMPCTDQRHWIVPETGCRVRGWPERLVAWFTKAISPGRQLLEYLL